MEEYTAHTTEPAQESVTPAGLPAEGKVPDSREADKVAPACQDSPSEKGELSPVTAEGMNPPPAGEAAPVHGKKKSAAKSQGSPAEDAYPIDCYLNRELSWLQFNRRVLEETADPANPLAEQLNFLGIYWSNLDEFFMVRVGALYDQRKMPIRDNKTMLTAREQLELLLPEVRRLNKGKDKAYKSLMKQVSGHGFHLDRIKDLGERETRDLERIFYQDFLPLLSPQVVTPRQPFPFLNAKQVYAVALLHVQGGKDLLGLIPCHSPMLPRLVAVPAHPGHFVLLEDLVQAALPKVFTHYRVISSMLIRVVRNGDISIDEEVRESEGRKKDYRRAMEKMIRTRTRLSPIKMDYAAMTDGNLLNTVCHYLHLSTKLAFSQASPLDFGFFDAVQETLSKEPTLFYPRRVPQASPAIEDGVPVTQQIRRHDILLSYPYESIRPFLQMLQEAAADPEVVSIKITLYRLARNSQVVDALIAAAENGKEVLALVELRARFDEENNVEHSRDLEAAGCRVIYGLDNIKIHSKLCLITRRRQDGIEYITQIGTGNYNEKTAKLYTDFCLMTAHQGIGADAAALFSALALGETVHEAEHLLISPECLQMPIAARLDREIVNAVRGMEAGADFKLNALTDKFLINKLIEASRAGVKIRLLVRGICCLVPGIPGFTDNISVSSIVGRYLEHSRIYLFRNGGNPELFIGSADLMTRNTLHRVEVAVPVYDDAIRARITAMYDAMWQDTAKRRILLDDGSYVRPPLTGEVPFNAQEYFLEQAAAATCLPCVRGGGPASLAVGLSPDEVPPAKSLPLEGKVPSASEADEVENLSSQLSGSPATQAPSVSSAATSLPCVRGGGPASLAVGLSPDDVEPTEASDDTDKESLPPEGKVSSTGKADEVPPATLSTRIKSLLHSIRAKFTKH